MASQSQRLRPLQQFAENREDIAARQLAGCRRQLAERENRLRELQEYLKDYLASQVPATPAMLANRHAFLQRLREAEAYQRNAVQQARATVEAERLRYLARQRDTGVLEQLSTAYRLRENLAAERREQRQMDEFASRRYFDASPGSVV